MLKVESPDEAIDWRLTTWSGARREQLRRWAALPLEDVLQAIEDMQELERALTTQSPARPDSE